MSFDLGELALGTLRESLHEMRADHQPQYRVTQELQLLVMRGAIAALVRQGTMRKSPQRQLGTSEDVSQSFFELA